MSSRFLALLLLLMLAAAGGCDEDDKDEPQTTRFAAANFPDALDPARGVSLPAAQAMWNVYTGLLTYRHEPGDRGTELQPGLADELPRVSRGGRRYELTLRDGARFSDGTAVRASDFAHSVKRVLAQTSPGAGFFTHIVGAEDFLAEKKGDLEGIVTDDGSGRITIDLVNPRPDFPNVLATTFAGVVPSATPLERNMTKDPPPGAGRYMIRNVRVNRGFELVRNPNFSLEGTAADAGRLDTVRFEVRSEASAATQILRNKLDFMVDVPPTDLLEEIRAKAPERFRVVPTGANFFLFMNAQTPPFDDVRVRQAVNWAVDREAVKRLLGGLAEPATTVLPPGMPGYEKYDLYPGPDLYKAKRLIRGAGATGAEVSVWSPQGPPGLAVAQYYQEVLKDLGFDAKRKSVAGEIYGATISNRETNAQTGWDVWAQDYPHPADFIDILLNPARINPTGNLNHSWNEDDHAFERRIEALLADTRPLDEVASEWAALDREAMEKAYWVPLAHPQWTTFVSDRMDLDECPGSHFIYIGDWANLCTK